MENQKSIWAYLGFCGVFYLIFLVVMVVGYPLADTYAKPIAALIFPIAGNNSLMKNLLVMTVMYWAMVMGSWFLTKKKE